MPRKTRGTSRKQPLSDDDDMEGAATVTPATQQNKRAKPSEASSANDSGTDQITSKMTVDSIHVQEIAKYFAAEKLIVTSVSEWNVLLMHTESITHPISENARKWGKIFNKDNFFRIMMVLWQNYIMFNNRMINAINSRIDPDENFLEVLIWEYNKDVWQELGRQKCIASVDVVMYACHNSSQQRKSGKSIWRAVCDQVQISDQEARVVSVKWEELMRQLGVRSNVQHKEMFTLLSNFGPDGAASTSQSSVRGPTSRPEVCNGQASSIHTRDEESSDDSVQPHFLAMYRLLKPHAFGEEIQVVSYEIPNPAVHDKSYNVFLQNSQIVLNTDYIKEPNLGENCTKLNDNGLYRHVAFGVFRYVEQTTFEVQLKNAWYDAYEVMSFFGQFIPTWGECRDGFDFLLTLIDYFPALFDVYKQWVDHDRPYAYHDHEQEYGGGLSYSHSSSPTKNRSEENGGSELAQQSQQVPAPPVPDHDSDQDISRPPEAGVPSEHSHEDANRQMPRNSGDELVGRHDLMSGSGTSSNMPNFQPGGIVMNLTRSSVTSLPNGDSSTTMSSHQFQIPEGTERRRTATYAYQTSDDFIDRMADSHAAAFKRNLITYFRTTEVSVNSEVCLLETKVKDLLSEMRKLNQAYAQEKDLLESKKSEVGRMNVKLDALSTQATEYESTVRQLHSQVQSLGREKQALISNIEEHGKNLETIKSEIASHNAKMDEIQAWTKEKETFKQDKNKLTEQSQALERDKAAFQNKSTEHQSAVEAFERDKAAFQKEKAEHQSAVEAFDSDKAAFQKEKAEHQSAVEAFERDKAAFQKEKAEHQSAVEALERDKAAILKRAEGYETEMKESLEAATKAHKELTELVTNIKNLEREKDQAKISYDQLLESQHQLFSQKEKELSSEHDRKLQVLESEKRRYEELSAQKDNYVKDLEAKWKQHLQLMEAFYQENLAVVKTFLDTNHRNFIQLVRRFADGAGSFDLASSDVEGFLNLSLPQLRSFEQFCNENPGLFPNSLRPNDESTVSKLSNHGSGAGNHPSDNTENKPTESGPDPAGPPRPPESQGNVETGEQSSSSVEHKARKEH